MDCQEGARSRRVTTSSISLVFKRSNVQAQAQGVHTSIPPPNLTPHLVAVLCNHILDDVKVTHAENWSNIEAHSLIAGRLSHKSRTVDGDGGWGGPGFSYAPASLICIRTATTLSFDNLHSGGLQEILLSSSINSQ
ncbi:hypothetical protein BDQ17DRAFT_1422685 [Cyathus striatus]|nr:hypothetical protein BDQ17DRAFT_1422685 [Cyathus striatus]